jgi:light-regulated signal transduction histidine kinase (bacteriophytochrome)
MDDNGRSRDDLADEVARLRKEVDSLSREAKELQRSNNDLAHFADTVSHDLQEPLRTTCSFLDLLKTRCNGHLDARCTELIDVAVRGSRRMSRMISDLRSLSKIQVPNGPKQPTDCESILTQATENLQAAIEESGATITHDPLPVVPGYRRNLVQLFQNLISNAIKYRGPEPPKIHVSATKTGGYHTLAVKDNGIGIDPAYTGRIFQVFERLHGPDSYPGTGIGLAICERVVERHGGRIWVESLPGTGSTFYFTLQSENGSNGHTH